MLLVALGLVMMSTRLTLDVQNSAENGFWLIRIEELHHGSRRPEPSIYLRPPWPPFALPAAARQRLKEITQIIPLSGSPMKSSSRTVTFMF